MDNCTCKITPGTSAYGGSRIDSRGCEKHDTRDEIIYQLRQERDNALRYTELLIAERDAAQSGEARAVEALRKLSEQVAISFQDSFGTCEEWLDSSRLEAPEECAAYEEAVAVLSGAKPALAWLAQQRGEAAAEALEQEAGKAKHGVSMVNFDTGKSRIAKAVLVDELLAEAAALRAGATGGGDQNA